MTAIIPAYVTNHIKPYFQGSRSLSSDSRRFAQPSRILASSRAESGRAISQMSKSAKNGDSALPMIQGSILAIMPEGERSGLYDPEEEFPWDCDLGLEEWGWEDEDDSDEEGEEGE